MFESLVTRLADVAATYPDKTAVKYRDLLTTYQRLWDSAVHISEYLLTNGLKKGDRVVLLRENSPEYIAAYYGILMAGGVVVALNTAAKSYDLINWIRHSGSNWIFTSSQNNELIDIANAFQDSLRFVLIGEGDLDSLPVATPVRYDDIVSDTYTAVQKPLINENDIATIIYTSGTTGHPKGVTLSHGNLVSNMTSILDYLPICNDDKFLCVLPFYYSYGNSVLHTNLLAGAELILENSFLFPHAILKTMETEGVTSFSGVPSTYAILLSRAKINDFNLSSLKYMTQAGGAMSPAHIDRLQKLLPDIQFFVMYGQTEATARLSYLPSHMLNKKIGSAGIAIPGVTLELRNPDNMKTRQGEVGEIYATGNNIMYGYWSDQQLTDTVLKDGWLKTGDLAYQDEDGFFYIVGRQSEMIKTGAHRISPLDIEEVLARCSDVSESAVIGVEDEILGQVIKAFVVLKPGSALTKRDLQLHCKNNLAIYKIPKYLEFINEIPKTSSGKIKRHELQKIDKE